MNLWPETFRKAWHLAAAAALLALAGSATAQRLSLDSLQAQINAKIALSDLAACAADDTVVRVAGTWKCKSTLPRFVDNGDGTVTDNQTGLMWEKKVDCGHADYNNANCVDNTYAWTTSSANLPDGTLFSSFLAMLNGGVTDGLPSPCFANHCDWRIPALAELDSIRLSTSPACAAPCIDPIFGPTRARYTSATIGLSTSEHVWMLAFDSTTFLTFGSHIPTDKTYPLNARAVRNATY